MEHSSFSPDHMPDTLLTPKGECMFAHLFQPRSQQREDGSEKSQYGIVLLLANPEVDPQTADFLKSLHGQFLEKFGTKTTYGPNGKPWKKESVLSPETGQEQETGLTRISFKRDTETRGGAVLPPPTVQDAKGQPWPSSLAVGNGSVVRVAFTTYLWDSPKGGKGISLNLLGVRILEHVPYSPQSLAPDAFGAPEEGADVNSPAVQSLLQVPANNFGDTGPYGDYGDDDEAPY